MQDIVYTIIIISASISVSMWLEKRRPIFARFSSGFMIILTGYTLNKLNVFEPQNELFTIANSYILPISLINAVMWSQTHINIHRIYSLVKNSFSVITITVLAAIVGTFILMKSGENGMGYASEFPSASTALISSIIPQAPAHLSPFGSNIQTLVASSIISISIIFTFFLFTFFHVTYGAFAMKMPYNGTKQSIDSIQSDYSIKLLSDINSPSGLLLALSISNLILFISIKASHSLHIIPLPFLVIIILILFKQVLPCRKLNTEFSKLASIGSHVMLFISGTVLSMAPWEKIEGQTFHFIICIILIKIIVIFFVGKFYKLHIETLCIIFITLACGPFIGALIVIAKKWEHLLIPTFILGFIGQIISWSFLLFTDVINI